MSKGLVVPDNPSPSTWKTVPFIVPDDPQWLGIITGLLFSPCNGYWWKKNSGDWETARDTMCLIGAQFLTVDFCGEVAECIDDNETIRDIIREIIKEYTQGDSGGSGVFGEGNPVFDGCNPDVIFGSVTSIVDYTNQTILDAFEIIEVSTNIIEAMNLWVDNVPILGAIPSFIFEAINWIQDNIQENYLANYTIGLRDTYRCDLFCLWIDNDCQLTGRDVFDYFLTRVSAPSAFSTFADIVTYLVGGVWSGTQIVDAMHALVFGAVAVDDAVGFFDIKGLYSFNTIVAVGANNPDADWSILCDCPEFWTHTFEFTLGTQGFESRVAGLSVNTVDGWISANTNPPAFAFQEAGCKRALVLGASTIDAVTIEYYSVSPKNTGGTFTWRLVIGGNNYDLPSGTGEQSHNIVITPITGNQAVSAFLHFRENVVTNSCAIRSITLSGSGANPF